LGLKKKKGKVVMEPTQVSVKSIRTFVKGKPMKFQLNKKAIRVFRTLQELPHEVGGRLDFNVDKLLERVSARLGGVGTVQEDFFDFEAEYHTHPKTTHKGKIELNPPSSGDVYGIVEGLMRNISRKNKITTQVALIFSHKFIYTIYFDYDWLEDKFPGGTLVQRARKMLNLLKHDRPVQVPGYLDYMTKHNEYLRKSEKRYGVKIYTFKWTDKVTLQIAPVEPLLQSQA